jgi:hypothetical protein
MCQVRVRNRLYVHIIGHLQSQAQNFLQYEVDKNSTKPLSILNYKTSNYFSLPIVILIFLPVPIISQSSPRNADVPTQHPRNQEKEQGKK